MLYPILSSTSVKNPSVQSTVEAEAGSYKIKEQGNTQTIREWQVLYNKIGKQDKVVAWLYIGWSVEGLSQVAFKWRSGWQGASPAKSYRTSSAEGIANEKDLGDRSPGKRKADVTCRVSFQ